LVPYYLGCLEILLGDPQAARRSMRVAIDVGNGTSVHGGWYGYEDESSSAMRFVIDDPFYAVTRLKNVPPAVPWPDTPLG
jgi:hypothetical protein